MDTPRRLANQLTPIDLNSFFKIKPTNFIDNRTANTTSKENSVLAKNKLSDLDMSGLNLSDLLLNSYETASKIVKDNYDQND